MHIIKCLFVFFLSIFLFTHCYYSPILPIRYTHEQEYFNARDIPSLIMPPHLTQLHFNQPYYPIPYSTKLNKPYQAIALTPPGITDK